MEEEKELSFFKKVIICIKDFEKYPMLASKGWGVVLAYMLKLLAIFTLIASFTFVYSLKKDIELSSIVSENTEISQSVQSMFRAA